MSASTDVLDVAPSLRDEVEVRVVAHDDLLDEVEAVSIPVTPSGDVPEVLGVDHEGLRRAGFSPTVGKALAFPAGSLPVLVAVGVGELAELDSAAVRDAAAAFAAAVPFDAHLATRVPRSEHMTVAEAAAAVVEGVLLARYRFSLRSKETGPVRVASLTLVAPEGEVAAVEEGAERGRTMSGLATRGDCHPRRGSTCPNPQAPQHR